MISRKIKEIKSPLFLFCFFIFIINVSISITYKHFDSKTQQKYETLRGSDAKGYYEYLEWGISGKNINYESVNSYKRGEGRILKYTYGTSLFQLPFYYIAKILQGNPQNDFEYTQVDDYLTCIGAGLYISLALALLYKLLKKFTTSNVTAYCVVAIIYLATNLLHYSAIELMMSHLYSFLSITGYLYYVLHYIETKHKRHFFVSLFFLFLIIAIRPFNIIIAIPICYYLYTHTRSLMQIVVSAIAIITAFIIQMILWRLQCGQWAIMSYEGEGFYWLDPQITNVLFGFRKGLFIYTPIAFMGLIGLIINYRFQNKFFWLLLLTCILFTYAVSCWWHWPYGSSYGHRAFIDVYAFFGIGLVNLLNWAKRLYQKYLIAFFFVTFLLLNIFQTWQYGKFILHPEYMYYGKYKELFFETTDDLNKSLGGSKDIFPFKAKYTSVKDSIMYEDMTAKEYSNTITFSKHFVNHKKCYLDVSFTKEEFVPNQSKGAKFLLEIKDTVTGNSKYMGSCVNEITEDYQTLNTKSFSFQFDLPQLKSTETLKGLFVNPKRKKFKVYNFKMTLYYILR